MVRAFTLLDLVYPRTCAGCGAAVGPGLRYLCWECMAATPWIRDPFCALCGDPVDGRVGHEYTCAWCVERRPRFDGARSAVRYRGPLREALHVFKYQLGTHLAPDLVTMLSACVRTHFARVPFDAVTFVPLHPRKERERTYNQARILARGVARALDLPLLAGCLRRARDTVAQADLTASERRRNVRLAFEAGERAWLEGRTLLLVDDVMTTGATVDECARALKKGGAAGVYVATVARG
jgi:ComF family protein